VGPARGSSDCVYTAIVANGVTVGYFPVGLGNLMNPCDNNFHSVFKRYYYRALEGLDHVSKQTKFYLAEEAYFKVKEDTITNYFRHCGLLGTKDPNHIVQELLREGVYPRRRFLKLHLKQLKSYLCWKGLNPKALPTTRPELLFLRKHFV